MRAEDVNGVETVSSPLPYLGFEGGHIWKSVSCGVSKNNILGMFLSAFVAFYPKIKKESQPEIHLIT